MLAFFAARRYNRAAQGGECVLTYQKCELCPRQCGVDRTNGERGFCQMPAQVKAARASAHYWEEPVLSGAGGSGAVFFSGCTLRCAYCQNAEISRGGKGFSLTSDALRRTFLQLIDDGVQNINLVTPTHFLPDILPALRPKLPVPVVYNCGGYERVETVRDLDGYVDVWLPDFKYSDGALAAQLSAAPDYPGVAEAAICEMVRQVGPPVIRDGELVRGVMVRHLVLPGFVDNTLGVIDRLAALFPNGEILFSLMRQYTPMGESTPLPDRRVTEEEYAAALSWAELCGLTNGFAQDASAAEADFIPAFDGSGLQF